MNFLELAKSRYSVRKFADRPIEQEKLDLISRRETLLPQAATISLSEFMLCRARKRSQS